jgi:hypothetical protein
VHGLPVLEIALIAFEVPAEGAVTSFSRALPAISRVLLTATMWAPASASASAIALPMPRLEPVTSAVLPSSLEPVQDVHG